MKVLIAPDSFKETLSSIEVCHCIEEGFVQSGNNFECRLVPISDGGEGMLSVLNEALKGSIVHVDVQHPHIKIQERLQACVSFVEAKKLVIIESAEALALDYVEKSMRNPLHTSSYGLGEILSFVHEHYVVTGKVDTIIIGIGGTATVDCGVGMLCALGVEFSIGDGKAFDIQSHSLEDIVAIDSRKILDFSSCNIVVASDVQNPTYGEEGAARVFGPQKGASPEIVEGLERGIQSFSEICQMHFNLDESQVNFAGGGAAGGLGMSLPVFCGAELRSGINVIMDILSLETHITHSDLVITGEGKVDGQSVRGKVVFGISQLAKKHKVPVCIIAGALDVGYEVLFEHGVSAMFSATMISSDWEKIKKDAKDNVIKIARSIAALLELNTH